MEQFNMFYHTISDKLYNSLDKLLVDIEVVLADAEKEDYSVLNENNIYYYTIPEKLEHDVNTQRLVNLGKVQMATESGQVVYTDSLEVQPIPTSGEQHDNTASFIRKRRDSMLSSSDWVVTKAFELGETVPADWSEYRQALRDITTQVGFPHNVEWPTKPQ
jgi:hypothetical protein